MDRHEAYKILKKIENYLESIKTKINYPNIIYEIEKIEKQMSENNFWDDVEKASKISQNLSLLKEKKDKFENFTNDYNDYSNIIKKSNDQAEDYILACQLLLYFEKEIDLFLIYTLLNNEYDKLNSIIEIHPGAGGTEAQDWAEMLFLMYQRWAKQKDYKFEIIDYQKGDEAGIKSVAFKIIGLYSYGYLKSEIGVHRLVRISPFDSNKRRHTSFASVLVMPEINEEIKIDLKEEDLKIDVYRSGGAGGQSVNTTDSAVRITHIPTNIVVTCQNERSQLQNKETAKKYLMSKLYALELEKLNNKLNNLKGEKAEIGWGSQIRSYVFQPYQMVKDLRTNAETSKVLDVMQGDIDLFIHAFLKEHNNNEKN